MKKAKQIPPLKLAANAASGVTKGLKAVQQIEQLKHNEIKLLHLPEHKYKQESHMYGAMKVLTLLIVLDLFMLPIDQQA